MGETGSEALREETAPAIREHRMGTLTVLAEPGAEVRIEQQRHAFPFGTAISSNFFNGALDDEPETRDRALQILRENFNAAVPENAMKWPQSQPGPDRWDWATFDRILEWCEAHGLAMRGHCLFWANEKYNADWVKQLDDEALRQAIERRIRATLTRYRGRVRDYDLNNEMVHHSYFKDRLGESIRVRMFQLAQEIAPDTPMFVNDYGILSGHDIDAYIEQIRGLIDAGAPVGGIGVQGHFGGEVPSAEDLKQRFDRLAEFGLPIVVTEYDRWDAPNEQQKAEELERFYRVAFAHPAVEGILMWGFWERAHWKRSAALWDEQLNPLPAAEAYRRLVFDEWWTDETVTADAEGRAVVPGFFGTHRVTAGGQARTVELTAEAGEATVDLR